MVEHQLFNLRVNGSIRLAGTTYAVHWGIAKLVKALDIDLVTRWFESIFPDHLHALGPAA